MPVACTEHKKDGSPLDGPSLLSFFYLLCAEDAVAGIAQAGDDVAVVVELLIHGGAVNLHVGMVLAGPARCPRERR